MSLPAMDNADAFGRSNPFPIAIALSLFLVALGGLAYMHPGALGQDAEPFLQAVGPRALAIGVVPFLIVLAFWTLRAIEAPVSAETEAARDRYKRVAMLLFILSEVAFFAAFFGTYFHYAIDPEVAGLTEWPPTSIRPEGPWGGPLLNTLILLASGACVASAHQDFLSGRRKDSILGLGIAIALGVVFLGLQVREFLLSTFGYTDGVYPSVFFLATGFHGFHVLIGASLLAVCLARLVARNLDETRRFGFEAAVWYWHFVDVIWLLLFAIFYAWQG